MRYKFPTHPLFAPRQDHLIRQLVLLLLLFCTAPAFPDSGQGPIHHQLQVEIQPDQGLLNVTDLLTLPVAEQEIGFLLHAALRPTLLDEDAKLITLELQQGPVPVRRYLVRSSQPRKTFSINYVGTINHPVTPNGESGNSHHFTPGQISSNGVFLSGSSYWYPWTGNSPIEFVLQVKLPTGWKSVSQGSHIPRSEGWRMPHPQEEIYLIAYPYHYYQQPASGHLAEVYLRQPNPDLARRYLDATGEYLALYEKLLGPYPYTKFALVENFWESGYGMPSFTLLGPRVIRLPFIVHSSYPHEILHNWWGNGVYVDASSGNWSEGLTTYLADHLLKEQQGNGAGYRRSTLQKYADYVATQDDFPLTQFRGNHGQISQSVGYGKALMLFHMLRMELGDQQFIQGLREFYRTYQFKLAGFPQLQATFESISGKDLTRFFRQWLTRTGAPTLKLAAAETTRTEKGYRLEVRVEQTQAEAPFWLRIPLFIHFADQKAAVPYTLEMDKRSATLVIEADQRPLRISADPLFDLFRRLDPSETPSSLGQLFGAKRLFAVLPAGADDDTRQAYRRLIAAWQQRQPGLTLLEDSAIDQLPEDGALWILGRENRFAHLFNPLLAQQKMTAQSGTLALTLSRNPENPQTLGYITTDNPAALIGLARKLPHYSRYSYALFSGVEPTVQQRGEWQITASALSRQLATDSGDGLLPVADHPPLSKSSQ